jgi:transposase
VNQLPVAWAEANGRFTASFEALVISWLREAAISGVAELLHLSWTEAAGIQQRAVNRGLKRRRKQPLKEIGIDESSLQNRHEYVTLVRCWMIARRKPLRDG